MAKFQLTLVRYERNPYAAADACFYEKWQFPCFLGVDENNNLKWWNCCFDTLVDSKNINNIFYLEDPIIPVDDNDYSKEACMYRAAAKRSFEDAGKNVVTSLLQLGLMPQKEKRTICNREQEVEYFYTFEGYRIERLVAKELLGIEIDTNKDLTGEQFAKLEKTQYKKWEFWNKLVNLEIENRYISFEGLDLDRL